MIKKGVKIAQSGAGVVKRAPKFVVDVMKKGVDSGSIMFSKAHKASLDAVQEWAENNFTKDQLTGMKRLTILGLAYETSHQASELRNNVVELGGHMLEAAGFDSSQKPTGSDIALAVAKSFVLPGALTAAQCLLGPIGLLPSMGFALLETISSACS